MEIRHMGRWVHGWMIALTVAATMLPLPIEATSTGSHGTDLVVADATASPAVLDPFKVYGTQAQSFFRLIFEPLVDRDPDGKIRTPLLERWGAVDALTWEFKLRPGVRFHDGGELTADDVVFSLRRILDPQVNSPRRHEFGELSQISAADPLTVRIVTKRPYVLLPARLSQFSMILPDQLRGRSEADFFQNPIGLGPFRLADLSQKQAVLAAFPDYHGGAPKVPRVVFEFIADPDERLSRLLSGSVDIVTNLLPQQVDPLVRTRGVRLLKRHSIRFMQVFIDGRRAPLSRTEVRQALMHGTDVEGLVRYVARGNGRPLATVTLPEDFGYHATLKRYSFDPVKARALLAEGGYRDGFRLQGLATHDTQTLATALAGQWAKLGVTLDVTVEGRAPAISKWIKERDQHDFLIVDPTSLIFDASFQLRMHLDPAHPVSRISHPRVLELLNRADSAQDAGARAGLLREVQATAHEQALTLPLYQMVDLYGVRDRVSGFVPSADTILRLGGVGLAR
jgi:peptide/nickel transport system substrate-binding protein